VFRNEGSNRGSAMSIEVGNSVVVSQCTFEDNASTNIGGAIYNRGALTLLGNTFFNNSGTVSVHFFAFSHHFNTIQFLSWM
jgi:predicted outer membrane repeat protein